MNLEIQFKYSIFIGLLFAIVTTGNEMSIGPFDVGEIREPCIKLQDFNNYYQSKVIIKYNNHVFDQIIARIYRIFVRDVLGFQNVILKEIEYNIPEEYDNNTNGYRPDDELLKTFNSIFDINESDSSIGVVNLAVWIPPNYHRLGEYVMTGESYAMGRFGWFVPKNLNKSGDLSEFLPYTIFSNPLDNSYQQFIIDKVILDRIYRFTERCGIPVSQCIYVPDHCNNVKGGCVTLLAPSFKDTSFIIEHINEYHLYVQVMWFDHRLQIVINSLYKHYMENSLTTNSGQLKRFVVLHWHPSEITVNPNIEFEQITMPHCEEMNTKDNTLCKYELMPIVSLYNSKIISNKNLDLIRNSLRYMQFEHLDNLFYAYHNATAKRNNPISLDDNIKRDMVSQNGIDYDILINGDADIYEKISCDWVTENVDKIRNWTNIKPKARKPVVRIGGIFPLGDSMYSGLTIAVDMAIYAINMNETLLPNIDLGLIPRDVECRADAVLREVINYLAYSYNNYLLGILGPACSETVEPIAGLSKHLSIPVISYSAEGANFMDRQRYPYFFRTIGENRQYEHVYLKLFEQLDWHRVAALTEDGQKYTEYISHMETELKRHNIELIANKKFPKDVKRSEMQENLEDLKRKNARIIIADINDEMAQIVMCEAYKLQLKQLLSTRKSKLMIKDKNDRQ